MKHFISIFLQGFFILTVNAQTVNFNASNIYPAGTYSGRIITGDFNKDGEIDIAAANALTVGKVAILLADGAGGYALPVLYDAGANSNNLKAIDADKDGNLDLVIINDATAGGISVLLGNGSGIFAAPVFYPSGGANAQGGAFGDFNKDGKMDMVVANQGPDNIALLIGDDAGHYAAPVNFPTWYDPIEIDTGDFNKDGNLDVIAAGFYGFNILRGDGAGSFSAYTYLNQGSNQTYSVKTGDFNNDGNMDVMVGGGYGLYYYKGKGNGTFFPYVNTSIKGATYAIESYDINKDGFLDILCSASCLYVLMNNGDGTFAAPKLYSTGNGGSGHFSLADFNMDGWIDMASGNSNSGTVGIVYGKPDASLKAATAFDFPYDGRSVTTADFNQDNITDIAFATDYQVYMVKGKGDGTFFAPTSLSSATGVSSIISGDFNEDGYADVAINNNSTSQVSVINNNGTGGFNTPVSYTLAASSYPYTLTCGYINADNHLDLVTSNDKSTGTVSVLYGTGTGTFGAATNYSAGSYPHHVTIGDFNEDGKNDLVVPNENSFALLTNTGSAFTYSTINSNTSIYGVRAADFNYDGHLDIVGAGRYSPNGSLMVLKGNGNGTFAPAVYYSVGSNANSVSTGFFNNDAYLDVVIFSDEAVTFFANDGAGNFTLAGKLGASYRETGSVTTSFYSSFLAPADFNMDGNTDLAVAGTGSAGLSILMNLNSPVPAIQPLIPASGITFSGITSSAFTVSWTNGSGAKRMVIVKAGNAIDQLPSDGSTATANSVFATGTDLGSGNFVVYNGTSTSVSITGLNPSTMYFVAIVEYNGSGLQTNYLISSYLQGNTNTSGATGLTSGIGMNDIKMYPNPVFDNLYIDLSKVNEIESVKVVDMLGRVLFETSHGETINVDMSELNKGMYFVQIQSTSGNLVRSIIKQ